MDARVYPIADVLCSAGRLFLFMLATDVYGNAFGNLPHFPHEPGFNVTCGLTWYSLFTPISGRHDVETWCSDAKMYLTADQCGRGLFLFILATTVTSVVI